MPGLVATENAARRALAGPVPTAPPIPAPPAHRGYQRCYEVQGRGGLCQLQQVRVHIRYRSGGVIWADYRQTYYEYFAFDDHDARVVDVHDFDVVRDGWRQAVVLDLVRQARSPRATPPRGEATVTVKKQFLIGRGEVEGAAPREVGPGARFGFLAHGPDSPTRAALHIARGDGSCYAVPGVAACPGGRASGRGVFAAAPRFRAFEHYRHTFADLTGRFVDRGGYLAVPESAP